MTTLKNRLTKLEDALGVTKLNVGNELERLKELALSGNAPKPETPVELKQKFADELGCSQSTCTRINKTALGFFK